MLITSRQFFSFVTLRALHQHAISCPLKSTAIRVHRDLSNFVNLSEAEYEQRAECTLTRLVDFFDSLPDCVQCHPDYDVNYSMGVLTATIAPDVGTYVINKQSANRQIWFSSPISGPKRYDYEQSGRWIYKHDNVALDSTLQTELRKIFSNDTINVPS